ncbi:uncharacterized protein [Elaeis guineensis]|uniref:Uncharacterized protein LOC105056295 isoform X2 n=1 Tax=Elaeis guineensis var. tenera TaxID=51953 RepID=A0A6I9S3W0_ELAGV|nr:uncharacterized protein LOC105056295 isoform X2 [Elaeis guineensis]
MGAYDSNPRKDAFYGREPRPPWIQSTEGGAGVGNLVDRFSGLGVSDSSKDSLFQVIKAVEDAENTIKQQLEENNQLKDELLRKTRELERYRLETASLRPSSDALRDDHFVDPYKHHHSNSPAGNEVDRTRWVDIGSSLNPQGTLVIHQNGIPESEGPPLQKSTVNPRYSESSKVNGTLKSFHGTQSGAETTGLSQLSMPSSTSLSPSRHGKEVELDMRFTSSGHGLMPVSEISSNVMWKQDLISKVREREEEIAQLRKHVADYSVKEAQIRNEKYTLEKRIAYMRLAFDQQQQDLVDAASKALSYRQDIIEENIRLTYALQAAQQERSTFVSSLLPLLSEYGLQPSVLDAQSIVSNLKVLFKHLQEKLIITEEKLKESQYQLAPWHAESSNNTSFPPQSPSHPVAAVVATPNKNSLEIVPQPAYSHAQSPISSPSNIQTRVDWEVPGNQNRQTGPSGLATKNPDHDILDRTSPPMSRNNIAQDTTARVNQGDSHGAHISAESKNQNPSFKDLVKGNGMGDSEAAGVQHGREPSIQWASSNSPYLSSGMEDPNSSYPYLPPVLEEPSSSFSEAAEDDPLPAVEGLRISGEAFPGRELQASGYSIHGTTSCNFEWVRYLEDGSVNYIEGAKQPTYLVTADDVDSYLAIEIQPLDDRKRKGEPVRVFANEQRKITCDPEMQEQIKKTLSVGHVSFDVLLAARFLDIWERAILAIKREGYSIKCNGPRGVVVTEKFEATTTINIPYGHPTEFSIQCANGSEYLLKTEDSSPLVQETHYPRQDFSWLRDTIVLTMRLFKMMAVEKRKGRKKGRFFK